MLKIKPEPLISIMMPAYNAASFIRQAIDSIRAQTYSNWELICYDDGSTDATVSIVEEIAAVEPRIHLYRGTHGGRGRARNAALQYCNGDLVAMCDADDISFPDRFAVQVDHLNDHPEIDAVGGFQVPFIGEPPDNNYPIIAWPTEAEAIAAKFDALRMSMPNCTAMIRRKCFDQVGGFDEALLRSQDFGFFLKLHRAGGKFANFSRPLVFYRQDNAIPSFRYWSESEKYHALAVERAGVGSKGISLSGKIRRALSGRMMVLRYAYFKFRRQLALKNGNV